MPVLLQAPLDLLFLQRPQCVCGHIYRRDKELDPLRTLCSLFDPGQVLVNLGKRRLQPPLAAQQLYTVDDQEYARWSEAKRRRDRVRKLLRPYPVSLCDVHLVALHLAGYGLNVDIREQSFHGVFSR
jgi:hypothetical protein